MPFSLPSSSPALLTKALDTAHTFVAPFLTDDVVGIVFLGALARGYFDRSADIDIAIFKRKSAILPLDRQFYTVDGFEVQVWLSDYEDELDRPWDMSRRWAYSQAVIHYDPHGKTAELLHARVPLTADERRWLMMSGLTLSEWYVNSLTHTWVERGSLLSAQHMFNQGLVYFFDMLFGLNNALVADMKWRLYCVEQLDRLPSDFSSRVAQAMLLHDFTEAELERRKAAFMVMWDEMRPIIEAEVGLTFSEMVEVV